MATIPVKNALGVSVDVQLPPASGRAAAALSGPVVLSTEDLAVFNALLAANQAVQGVLPVVVGTDAVAQRGLMAICTVAGNATVKFADDSTAVVPVAVGMTLWPFAVKTVTVTTATATYYRTK